MTWFWVDDGLHSHPKAMRAGGDAMGLWVLAGSWCARHQTDGFIPEYAAASLDPKYRGKAARLVTARLWSPSEREGDKGWQFHEWAGDDSGRRNYTREENDQRRKAGAARTAASRARRSGDVTRYTRVTDASDTRESRVSNGVRNDYVRVSNTDQPHPTQTSPDKNPVVPVVDLAHQEKSHSGKNGQKPLTLPPNARCPEHGRETNAGARTCAMCGAKYGDEAHWVHRPYEESRA